MPGRREAWIPVAIVVALILSACSSSSDDQTADSDTDPDAAVTVDAGSGSGPLSEFQSSIDAMVDGYTFDTDVTVDGTSLTRVTGVNVAGDTAFTVESSGDTVEVVAIGSQTWTRVGEAAWQVATAGVEGGDPLAPLRSVETAAFDPDEGTLHIDVPGSALGVDLDIITIDATVEGSSVRISYESDGAAVTSLLSPAPPGAVIAAPDAVES